MVVPSLYLLDTNILVLLLRGSLAGRTIAENYRLTDDLTRCLISVVTVGEMNALARKWNWGLKRIHEMERILERLIWVDIDHPEILRTYGELDHVSAQLGYDKLGKNDLWIAATTQVTQSTLLTTDGDFDHLHPVQMNRIRFDPHSGQPIPSP
jgi:tRNA(fMet)-specific endonuclease VapC